MSLKALPHDVRTILRASCRINNYKTAIEELVYNSLDAVSTSIAIRVHILENRIQVIDNGCGILKKDFDVLGQRYMTSKLTDISTLKSVPKCYGYRGEFLANILEISQCVKIISRHKDGEETWVQTFYEGKKRQLAKTSMRPSKGSTVEIKGFLYNLNIQKRGINPVNDMQNIKAFLEQLSIIHNDISLSLRDDSSNEIIFKIHKNRNTYQTLSTLFNINQNDVQELQIEKNQYKVKAFIGKRDTVIARHLIYVNGKFVQNSSKLHKIIDDILKKYLLLRDQKNSKSRNHQEEEHLLKSSVPFYLILVTCPYLDYEIGSEPCQSAIEFNSWLQIKKMLEKLVKFYFGDLNLKEMKITETKAHQANVNPVSNKTHGVTPCQIKKIIEKILGNNSKKLRISQLQNGVKGKLIKRRKRNKTKKVNNRDGCPKINKVTNTLYDGKSVNIPMDDMNFKSNPYENLVMRKDSMQNITLKNKDKCIQEKNKKDKTVKTDIISNNDTKTFKKKRKKKIKNNSKNKMSNQKTVYTPPFIENNPCRMKPNKVIKSKVNNNKKHLEMSRFLEETDKVPEKSKEIENKNGFFVRRHSNYKTIKSKKHKNAMDTYNINNFSIGFKVPSIPKMGNRYEIENMVHKMKTNPFKTTYDLVQTILESQWEIRYYQGNNSREFGVESDLTNNLSQQSVTFPMNRLPLNDDFPKYVDLHYSEENETKFNNKMPWDDKNNITSGEYISCNLMCEKTCSTNTYIQYKSKCKYHNTSVIPKRRSLRCADIFKDLDNIEERKIKNKIRWHDKNNVTSGEVVSCNLMCENTISTNNDIQCKSKDNYYSTSIKSMRRNLRCENSNVFCTQHYSSSYSSNLQTVSNLTYDSHRYNHHCQNISNTNRQQNKQFNSRFITNLSRDNFITAKSKFICNTNFKNKTKESLIKRNQYYGKHLKQMIDESYNIEFTTSNEINENQCSTKYLEKLNRTYTNNLSNQNSSKYKYCVPNYEPSINLGNTYTIPTHCISSNCSSHRVCHNNTPQYAEFTIPHKIFEVNSLYGSKGENNNYVLENNINIISHVKENMEVKDIENNIDVVATDDEIVVTNTEHIGLKEGNEIILKTKHNDTNYEKSMDEDILPVNLCETVFHEATNIEKEFALSFNNNSKENDSLPNNINTHNVNCEQISKLQNVDENVSHHFSTLPITNNSNSMHEVVNNSPLARQLNIINKLNKTVIEENSTNCNLNIDHELFELNDNSFNFKERLRFLPKGMSQIFEKSGSKALCQYNIDKDYYEDTIYNDFADDIQMQIEIYEPVVQNVDNLSTRDIQKFKKQVQKDNTSLTFDERSLKEAHVLNQVDRKFIATIMTGKQKGLETISEYLILFDQHAVHERIRLENNLSSYFIEDKWKSVAVNGVTLKMSKDEIVYLHNYKDKFNQLGLQWTILGVDDVSITSIPEAILGKNPREVDKVMKAVKNLIMEEINVIKLQKGCISLYPKSIMDLVFSEACRYAIKFGDKLSKNDCIDLLNDLSNCKTPFQCAHGRPVMAVLVDIKNDNCGYKINIESLNKFKLKRKK